MAFSLVAQTIASAAETAISRQAKDDASMQEHITQTLSKISPVEDENDKEMQESVANSKTSPAGARGDFKAPPPGLALTASDLRWQAD